MQNCEVTNEIVGGERGKVPLHFLFSSDEPSHTFALVQCASPQFTRLRASRFGTTDQSDSRIQRFRGFNDSKIQGFEDSRIQGFEDEGFKDEGFKDEGFKDEGFAISD